MSGSRLTPFQRRILGLLAGIDPHWTLTGGGALAGVHLGHRETRDLDLFWRSRTELGTLVAEPFAAIEPPEQVLVEGAAISVDSRHEILASKLATLLERSEVRDLTDVKALLDAGGDLRAALRDAPKKDAGFSALTLAWVLKDYDPRPAVRALGWDARQAEELLAFRQWLIEQLTASAVPE